MPPPAPNPPLIYKIATAEVAEASWRAGTFTGMPVDHKDGFLHFSTAAQLAETLRIHFSGQDDLVLFAFRPGDHGAQLRWEPSRGGDLFPHLYGELPMSAVIHAAPIAVDGDGRCTLPDWAG